MAKFSGESSNDYHFQGIKGINAILRCLKNCNVMIIPAVSIGDKFTGVV